MSLVEWTNAARDQLADIWVLATPAERTVIERVVVAGERDLADDPLAVGESRFDRVRVAIRPPLTIWFEISADGSRVRIFRIRRPRKS
jgi:plasmid stabilization system protein ParE